MQPPNKEALGKIASGDSWSPRQGVQRTERRDSVLSRYMVSVHLSGAAQLNEVGELGMSGIAREEETA